MKKLSFVIAVLASVPSLFAQVTLIRPDTVMTLYRNMQAVNGKLLYFGTGTLGGFELWATDGTDAGTYRVKDINPNAANDVYILQQCGPESNYTYVYNGAMYFLADDGMHGTQIWKSDGTDAGTTMLKDINGIYGAYFTSCEVPEFQEFNGNLYFKAYTNAAGCEFWRSDGTDAGTFMVKDILPGLPSSEPYFFTPFSGSLYFTAHDPVDGEEVFISDGTSAGTHVFKDIVPGINGALDDGYGESINAHFNVSGNYLYFLADTDGLPPVEGHLWRTDGTVAGTIPLETTLHPTNIATQYDHFYADANGQLLFQSDEGTTSSALFKSNGTPAGTGEVVTNNGLVALEEFFSYNNEVYFHGLDNTYAGLCKSDGTTAGTDMVHSFTLRDDLLNMRYFTEFDGYMFFEVERYLPGGGADWRIVQSNGTDLGTTEIYGVAPESPMTALGNDLIFYGRDTITSQTGLYKLHPLNVGVQEIATEPTITAFPNPASSQITLRGQGFSPDGVEASLFDASGRLVEQEHVVGVGPTAWTMSIPADLMDGFYLLRMQDAGMHTATTSVVVQRDH